MKQYEYMAPCHFGIEAVLKRELQDLGYEITQVEDGKITFKADQSAIARANIFLRTAERIMIKTGKFKAKTFDDLFESTKAIPWENYLPKDGEALLGTAMEHPLLMEVLLILTLLGTILFMANPIQYSLKHMYLIIGYE